MSPCRPHPQVDEEDLPLTAPPSPADRSPGSPTSLSLLLPTVEYNGSPLDDAIQSPKRTSGKGLTRLPSIPEELRTLTRLPSIPEELGQHLKEEEEEETQERRWPRPGGDDFFIEDEDEEEERMEGAERELFFDTIAPPQDDHTLLPTRHEPVYQTPVKRVTIVLPNEEPAPSPLPLPLPPTVAPHPEVACPAPACAPSFATERLVYLTIIVLCLCIIAHDHSFAVTGPGLSDLARETVEALHRAEAIWFGPPLPIMHIS